MTSTYFVKHQGHDILYFDFANVTDHDEALRLVAEAKDVVAGQPRNSLLTLVDVRGSSADREITWALKDLAEHDRPYVIASAIVGLEGVKKVISQAVARLAGRTFAAFDTVEEAQDWLVRQLPATED